MTVALETSDRVRIAGISVTALDVEAHERAVDSERAGAVVTFVGRVRDHDQGRDVMALEYVAHPTAAEVIRVIAGRIALDFSVESVAVTHRHGLLEIGDAAVVVTVSAAHRREAFEACAALVEAIKVDLPVWKRQQFDDGSHEWVGSA